MMRYCGRWPSPSHAKEFGEVDPATLDHLHQLGQAVQQRADLLQFIPADPADFDSLIVADEQCRALRAQVDVNPLHLGIVQHVLDFLFPRQLIERRLRDIHAAGADQFGHVAEEERQQ